MANRRSVLITGCSDGGMGAALALAMHKRGGFRVIATARNLSKMARLKVAGIELLSLDVLASASIAECVKATSELLQGQGLDMLVNNAGAGYSMPIVDIELQQLRNVYELNVFSLVTVTQAFLPLLRKSASPVIVNHTSVASRFGVPMQSAYNSSKSAASMLTVNLRQELGAFDIAVVELKTATVRTNFFQNVPSAGTADILPKGSIYESGRQLLDPKMTGEALMEKATHVDEWAQGTAAKLARSKPPREIWLGEPATLLSWLQYLPLSFFDGMFKGMMNLDKFEKLYKKQKAGVKTA